MVEIFTLAIIFGEIAQKSQLKTLNDNLMNRSQSFEFGIIVRHNSHIAPLIRSHWKGKGT
jgi:hypothetical protein